MKPKHIEKYLQKYKDVSSDTFTRIREFLSRRKFNKNDRKRFHDELSYFVNKEPSRIKIVFDAIPEATPRPRLGQGRWYVSNSSNNSRYTEILVNENSDILPMIATPCKLIVNSYMPTPGYFNKVDTLLAELGVKRPLTKPDWDNLGKTYSDMVQKWIISDDRIIVDGESHKYYSMKPRVEIIIEY